MAAMASSLLGFRKMEGRGIGDSKEFEEKPELL
jgi:hypothetical protein